MVYTMSVTFFYVAVYAFTTGSSDIYINYFHIQPKVYSLLFGVNILAHAVICQWNVARSIALCGPAAHVSVRIGGDIFT